MAQRRAQVVRHRMQPFLLRGAQGLQFLLALGQALQRILQRAGRALQVGGGVGGRMGCERFRHGMDRVRRFGKSAYPVRDPPAMRALEPTCLGSLRTWAV